MLDGRRLLTTKEVAEYSGYSQNRIYIETTAGKLRPVTRRISTGRPGRAKGTRNLKFRLKDVEDWLQTT